MQQHTLQPAMAELSLEQWANLDDDIGGELVDGRLAEEEMPSNLHEVVVSWLIVTLGLWARERGARVLGSEHKLGLAPRRGRKPDVSIYAPGAKLLASAGMSRTPPHVVIEVVSPRPRDVRRDRADKSADYAAFGVAYYWLVDPVARLFEVFELSADGRYVHATTAHEGRVELPGCPGVVLDLDALWADVDALDHDEPPPSIEE